MDKETKSFFVLQRVQSLTDSYRQRLSVKPISSDSYIVELAVKGNVASKEMAFLNKLLEVYLKKELYKKNQLGLKTIQFIDSQLNGASDTAKGSEGMLELFGAGNSMLDISSGADNLNRNLRKSEVDTTNLENTLKYYRFLANSLQQENGLAKIVMPTALGVNDATLNNLLAELAKLVQERAALSVNLRENGALVEIVDSKINNSRKSLMDHIAKQIQTTSGIRFNGGPPEGSGGAL